MGRPEREQFIAPGTGSSEQRVRLREGSAYDATITRRVSSIFPFLRISRSPVTGSADAPVDLPNFADR